MNFYKRWSERRRGVSTFYTEMQWFTSKPMKQRMGIQKEEGKGGGVGIILKLWFRGRDRER